MKKDDREIDELVTEIEREFGKGAIVRGRDLHNHAIRRVPTGIFILDYLMWGGLPAGKVSLFRGREGSGKSLLALLTARSFQKRCAECLLLLDAKPPAGCKCKRSKAMQVIYADAEGKYPELLARSMGFDLDRFSVLKPENAEQAIDMTEMVLRDESVGFYVLDSIASLVPMIEIEKSVSEWQQGVVARECNKLMRRITGCLQTRAKRGTAPTIILINQERLKIGIPFGDPTTIPGGEGQKYIASMILRSRAKRLKDDELPKGQMPTKIQVAFTILKHSFGPAYLDGEYTLSLADGGKPCVREHDWLTQATAVAQARGLIVRNGKGIDVPGIGIKGCDELTSFLVENPDKAAAFRALLIASQPTG